MSGHIITYLLCVPFIAALGVFNTHRRIFTIGEIRFWGISIFVAAELIYIGVFY